MLLSLIKKYKIFNILASAIILFLFYLQLLYWQKSWLGLILLICFLLASGQLWQNILRRVFGLNRKTITTKIFAILSVFFLLGIFSSVCLVFYKLTPLIFFYIYLVVAVLSYLLHQLLQKNRVVNDDIQDALTSNFVFLKSSYLVLLGYLVIWLAAFYWLVFVNQPSTSVAQSPWQIINSNYLLVFFVLTLLSGLFLLAKYKIKIILLVLVLQTLLLHLYLPLSHQIPWGGDVWRHLSVENQLADGKAILPVLIGDEAAWGETANIKLPNVFFAPQKYAYGHLWGTSVLLAKTLSVDLVSINIWLMPILWSLVLPLLLFRIGWLLFGSKRSGLWLVWLSLLPFPLQVLGSLSLPVSLGFLLFLFTLMFWLQYWQDGEAWQKRLAIFFSLLMLFGYSLYFVLIWAVVVLSHIIYHISHNKLVRGMWYVVCGFFISILSILIIPTIELLSKLSFIPTHINWLNNFKQLVGQFSGWFYAVIIRPHDILSGNIIFNHTPDYAFVANIFNNWRWWLIPGMMIMWSLVVLGVYKIFKIGDKRYEIIGLLFSTVFGGYIIGWFVLDGDRLFTRRLDVLLSLLILVSLITSISYLLSLIKKSIINNNQLLVKILMIIIIFIFSWFTTFTYASGPDMRVVSVDEFSVAKYINNNIQYPISNIQYCVLADTWVLLPLEAISDGKIIGGGFPIDYQFGQTERVALFNKFTANSEASDLLKMKQLTGAEHCYFIQNGNSVDIDKINKLMNSQPQQIGELFIWYDQPITTSTAGLKKGKK